MRYQIIPRIQRLLRTIHINIHTLSQHPDTLRRTLIILKFRPEYTFQNNTKSVTNLIH